MTYPPASKRSAPFAFATYIAGPLTLAGLIAATGAQAACVNNTPLSPDLGSYSGPAVKAGAVAAVSTNAGLNCPSAVVVLLGTNYLKAKFSSANNLTLIRQGGTESFAYTASAAPDGTYAFSQNGTVDYMLNNLLNVLGLLGGTTANVPIYFKPTGGTAPINGVYKDTVTLTWTWDLCNGIGALGACIGDHDVNTTGTVKTVINVQMTVVSSKVTMTTSTTTTWDPVNTIVNPKTIPAGKFRTTVVVNNADLVDVDSGSLAIVVPTPSTASVALGGDGVSSVPVALTFGSSLAMTYTNPTSTTDDVDFSSDNGLTWTYQPSASSQAQMDAITHVRIRPRNALTKGTSATFTVSYSVK